MKLIIYLSYFFFLSEFVLMLLKRSKKASVSKRSDKGSLLILWFSIIISLTAGFYISNYSLGSFANMIAYYPGLLIFLAGMILRWSAILQLKKAFTVDVSVNKEHLLKTDGLYKKIRHPSYLGLILILTGLSVAMNNLISILIIIISIFAAVSYRINIEEKLLAEEFGDSYERYRADTRKIIPGIF